MRVGNIGFSDEFFSTTASVGEVKRTLEDELVRQLPARLPSRACSRLAYRRVAAQLLHPR